MATRILSKTEVKEWDRFANESRRLERRVNKILEAKAVNKPQTGGTPAGHKSAWWVKDSDRKEWKGGRA